MSGKQERERRREERLAAESRAGSSERRTRLMQMAAAAAFLVVIAVVVLIVVNANSGDGGGDTNLEGVSEVNQELSGIPQRGMVLGDPAAPVELVEFGDLQCPACKAYAEEVLPQVIEGPVAQGQSTLAFRNFTIIGPESVPAGAAALAAGEQGRGWHFIEIFYKNQGKENDGYITDEFVTSVAEAAGVEDIAQWNEDRAKLKSEVERTTAEAQRLGLGGTPSFAIKGPATNGKLEVIDAGSGEELENAISAAS